MRWAGHRPDRAKLLRGRHKVLGCGKIRIANAYAWTVLHIFVCAASWLLVQLVATGYHWRHIQREVEMRCFGSSRAAVVASRRQGRGFLRLGLCTALLGILGAAVAMLALAGSALAAGFGVTEQNFEAGTCTVETCTYASPHTDFYTQAAGHPPFGVTLFEFNHEEPLPGVVLPVGKVKNIRFDLPPGLAANPEAIEQCDAAE